VTGKCRCERGPSLGRCISSLPVCEIEWREVKSEKRRKKLVGLVY
jgi:hypothetical protein